MKLLLATHNKAKIDEYKKYLKYYSTLELITLDDLGLHDSIDETGRTFKENALLKAQYYGDKTNLCVIADDGGLVIKALNGEPGIKSRRWLGHRASDKELINYTLERMNGIEDRFARMVAGLIFYDPSKHFYNYFEDYCDGVITKTEPEWYIEDYPFRALLLIPEYNKLWQDLTDEELETISHRKRICQKFIEYLQKNYI